VEVALGEPNSPVTCCAMLGKAKSSVAKINATAVVDTCVTLFIIGSSLFFYSFNFVILKSFPLLCINVFYPNYFMSRSVTLSRNARKEQH
jgi:hypothetical protein